MLPVDSYGLFKQVPAQNKKWPGQNWKKNIHGFQNVLRHVGLA